MAIEQQNNSLEQSKKQDTLGNYVTDAVKYLKDLPEKLTSKAQQFLDTLKNDRKAQDILALKTNKGEKKYKGKTMDGFITRNDSAENKDHQPQNIV